MLFDGNQVDCLDTMDTGLLVTGEIVLDHYIKDVSVRVTETYARATESHLEGKHEYFDNNAIRK